MYTSIWLISRNPHSRQNTHFHKNDSCKPSLKTQNVNFPKNDIYKPTPKTQNVNVSLRIISIAHTEDLKCKLPTEWPRDPSLVRWQNKGSVGTHMSNCSIISINPRSVRRQNCSICISFFYSCLVMPRHASLLSPIIPCSCLGSLLYSRSWLTLFLKLSLWRSGRLSALLRGIVSDK